MTFVKRVKQATTNFLLNFTESIWKGHWVSVLGIGHSDIRGFGFLLTDRSMVRREPYRLIAWITVPCANIVSA